MSCRAKIGEFSPEITLSKNQCEKLDLKSILFLPNGEEACGTRACVYETGNPDVVVKITEDVEDVRGFVQTTGSSKVVGAKDLRVLKAIKTMDGEPVFAMVVEKAEPLDRRDQIFINDVLFSELNQDLFRGLKESEPFEVKPEVRKKIAPKCREIVKKGKSRADSRFSDEDEAVKACELVVGDAVDAIEEFGQSGVLLSDNHAGNWGRRKGKLVAIDLGMSTPPWAPREAKVKALAGNRGESIRRQWPRRRK